MRVDEEILNTGLENLYEALEIDAESSYESFVIKMNSKFNNEVDMYGDLKKAGDCSLKVKLVHFNRCYRCLNLEFLFPMK
jgi:hypothetical protein